MAFYITQRRTDFLDKKADTASLITPLPPHRLLQEVADPGSDAVWIHVANFIQGVAGRQGWVERANITEATSEQVPRAALSTDAPETIAVFVAECVSRAWTANPLPGIAPFYVDPDYLIALALIQSGLTNPAGAGPGNTRVGPFGITVAEWKTFTDATFDDYKYKDYELQLPLFQVAGAAWQMHTDAQALSAKWQVKGVGTAADPYLPSFGELLRCRLIGVDRTFAMHVKVKENQGSQMLPDFLNEQGISAADADALMNDRANFMRVGGVAGGAPLSLDGFNAKCAELLDAALKRAFELIKDNVPEAVQQPTGDAPWMAFAQHEKGVDEVSDAGKTRIHEYFQSTGFTQGTAADRWCAAFVAWCMDQCGPPVSTSFNSFRNDAAGAVHWQRWGEAAIDLHNNPPVGAVVVLSPSKTTNKVSHVGFFKSFNAATGKVTIFGGNQSSTVRESDFDTDDVVEIRWLSAKPPPGGSGGSTTPIPGAAIPATENDVLILARTIYGEARNLDTEGCRDVASVMINRAKKQFRHKTTVAAVCLDPQQFSCWNLDDPNHDKIVNKLPNAGDTAFDECFAVATDAVKGAFPDLTGGALHYYAKSMKKPPSWVTGSPDHKMTHEDAGHYFFTGIR